MKEAKYWNRIDFGQGMALLFLAVIVFLTAAEATAQTTAASLESEGRWFANPVIKHVGYCETTYIAVDVAVERGLAYVTSLTTDPGVQGALDIIDVSNGTKPYIVGSCTDYMLKFPVAISLNVAGGRAYVSDCYAAPGHHSYVHIINISNPASPYITGEGQSQGNSVDVVYRNGLYYEACFSGGLSIHEADSGWYLGGCYTSADATGLALRGNFAYVGEFMSTGGGVLAIVDVEDPFAPYVRGLCRTTGSGAKGVCVTGNAVTPFSQQHLYAFVADKDGLQIIDVTDPDAPFRITHVDLPGDSCLSVYARKEYAFVTAGSEGLYVIDIRDPYSPVIVAHSDEIGVAERVAVVGNTIYVTDSADGGVLHVFKLTNS